MLLQLRHNDAGTQLGLPYRVLDPFPSRIALHALILATTWQLKHILIIGQSDTAAAQASEKESRLSVHRGPGY